MIMSNKSIIGVLGAGSMGSGIAQVAATAGHKVILLDANQTVLEKAKANLNSGLNKLAEKGKISKEEADAIFGRITFAKGSKEFESCSLVIEAVIENLDVKQSVFKELEGIVSADCILATNTSSISIVSIAAACNKPGRFIGIHFFNPATLMPLVEIIPGLTTDEKVTKQAESLIKSWNKITVLAKDTPGFIVNRIARPFYGEAIKIYEEGIADFASIDAAMRERGFKMGPFELMDFIGNDVNFKVTETVWEQFFYDSRYKPSLTQKRLYEAKLFGRKSGRGYYNYSEGSVMPEPSANAELKKEISDRILAMLINEAIDALYLKIATAEDIDLAMTKGVNYPKGLIKWGEEIGFKNVLNTINQLRETYREERYRASVLLKRFANKN